MVFFKYRNLMHQLDHQSFDALLGPGEITPYSGIYRCEACGCEIVSSKGLPMPSTDHHRHGFNQGPVLWRLIVRTIQKSRELTKSSDLPPAGHFLGFEAPHR